MILLTKPYALSGPNITTTNDLYAKCTSCTANWETNTVTMVFQFGNLVGGAFVPDGNAPIAITVQANSSTASFSASGPNGFNENGSLPAQSVTNVQTAISAVQTALQATAEGFVSVSGGLLPGTVQAG